MTMVKRYSDLVKRTTFEERYHYLALRGTVGEPTFGWERYLNQKFYNSAEWRSVRRVVIIRDDGCDLGIPGREITGRIYIHHMNPMVPDHIRHAQSEILDPEYLISVSHTTHNAIHYGDENQLPRLPVERRPGDTKLW